MDEIERKIALRIIDLSYKHKLSHVGSCLNSLDLILEAYRKMKDGDRFVLSNGHAGLALYCVLEHFGIIKDAERVLTHDGIHPVRNVANGIYVSTGSLGQGITVAVGMAIARPNNKIHVLCSDGEIAEGAWWEAVYFRWRKNLTNLLISVTVNGWTALERSQVPDDVLSFFNVWAVDTSRDIPEDFEWFDGLDQHYKVLNENEYKELRQSYELA